MTSHDTYHRPLPDIAGVQHRFVKAKGLQFHVAEAGKGEPVLLLHGWPQHWYAWRHLIKQLQDDYHVICPDLRGFGWSDAPPSGYEKRQLVADIVAILNAMGVERVQLVGHDWGGWIAFQLCLHYPERIKRFVGLGIIHPWQRFDLPLLRNSWRFGYQLVIGSPLLGPWLVRTQPRLLGRLMRWDSAGNGPWSEPDLRLYTDPLRDPARARASSLLYRTWLQRETIPVLRGRYRTMRLQVPTLLLLGGRDVTIPPSLTRGYEPYADSMTVEVIPDVGHFLPEECPDLVADRVRAFTSST